MKVQIAASVSERMFADWAMLHDPAVSWIWTQSEVAEGAIAGATPEKLLSFFLPLCDEHNARLLIEKYLAVGSFNVHGGAQQTGISFTDGLREEVLQEDLCR